MNFKIEKGIPMPRPKSGTTSELRAMAVGDSFAGPLSLRATIYGQARQAGIKVAIRRIEGDQIRVWRIE